MNPEKTPPETVLAPQPTTQSRSPAPAIPLAIVLTPGTAPEGTGHLSQQGGQGAERQYHLDALRSILMILGVFLHGSYPYADKPWIIKDDDVSPVLIGLNASIHFFRIPCFFILSGYFAMMLIERMGKSAFIKMRMKRLALPLVSTALLFNSVQAYFLHGVRTDNWSPAAFIASGAFTGFWIAGRWIGHLWFLVYVLAFSIAAAGLRAAGKGRGGERLRAFGAVLSRRLSRHGLILALLPLANLAAFALAGLLPIIYRKWGGISLYGLLTFGPYFAFGLIVFTSPRMRREFHRIRPWQAIAIPAALLLEYFLGTRISSDWARAAIHYLDAYLVWSCCAALFALFRRLLNRRSPLFIYLSEASYSIYLFHHLCVVAFAAWLALTDWNVLAKFSLVVGLSLAISLALHHFLVLRIPLLRLLFMGK
jgi:glucan biosynthesis protein C